MSANEGKNPNDTDPADEEVSETEAGEPGGDEAPADLVEADAPASAPPEEGDGAAGDSNDTPEKQDGEKGGAKPPGPASPKRPRKRTPRVQSPAEAKAVIECLLFAATEPQTLAQIRQTVHPITMKELQGLVVELQNEYDKRGCGLQIVEIAGGYQLATRPRYADWLVNYRKKKRRSGLSAAMLETVAIIAYKQPIIRAEIDAIRGVDTSGVVHSLQEAGLVEVVGQKQVPGRPFLYGTTKDFLKYFGLKSLSEMPSIEALRERFDLPQE